MITNLKAYYAPMHTAEHILNQTMCRMFNCGRSVSHHIEKKKSKCDYRFERDITDAEAAAIETKVNEIIKNDLVVSDLILSSVEAMNTYKLERMPDGEESVRVVLVGNYDACACSGNHVEKTSEIGKFNILSHSFEEGKLRIRFKLEGAALKY